MRTVINSGTAIYQFQSAFPSHIPFNLHSGAERWLLCYYPYYLWELSEIQGLTEEDTPGPFWFQLPSTFNALFIGNFVFNPIILLIVRLPGENSAAWCIFLTMVYLTFTFWRGNFRVAFLSWILQGKQPLASFPGISPLGKKNKTREQHPTISRTPG